MWFGERLGSPQRVSGCITFQVMFHCTWDKLLLQFFTRETDLGFGSNDASLFNSKGGLYYQTVNWWLIIDGFKKSLNVLSLIIAMVMWQFLQATQQSWDKLTMPSECYYVNCVSQNIWKICCNLKMVNFWLG